MGTGDHFKSLMRWTTDEQVCKQEMVLGGLSIFRLAYLNASNCTLQFTAQLFDSDNAQMPVLTSKQALLEVC